MTTPYFERRDEKTTLLLAMIARIETELAAPASDSSLATVRSSWAEMVKLMALETPPAVRACPACKFTGLREATRCMNCWIALVPPDAKEAAAAIASSKDAPAASA